MTCFNFFFPNKNKIKYIKQYKLIYNKIKFPKWWELFYIKITNIILILEKQNPDIKYMIINECAAILLCYCYNPELLHKFKNPNLCSFMFLSDNDFKTPVFLDTNSHYNNNNNNNVKKLRVSKTTHFIIDKKYKNHEWFNNITIILKSKSELSELSTLNTLNNTNKLNELCKLHKFHNIDDSDKIIDIFINNTEFKVIHPILLHKHLKEFKKSNTIEYNNNDKYYTKFILTIIEKYLNLEFKN